jgi:hypothetical protein
MPAGSIFFPQFDYWVGPGPNRANRFLAAPPRFQFPYPDRVSVTQQYVEEITSGDPASQTPRLTQQYSESITTGDPASQKPRVTQQYVEVITEFQSFTPPGKGKGKGGGGGKGGGKPPPGSWLDPPTLVRRRRKAFFFNNNVELYLSL